MGVCSDSRFSCAILDFLIQDLTPEKNATAKKVSVTNYLENLSKKVVAGIFCLFLRYFVKNTIDIFDKFLYNDKEFTCRRQFLICMKEVQ